MDQRSDREKILLGCKSFGLIIFIFFGAFGFFFSLWKNNWNLAGWCLLLEIACVFISTLMRSYLKSELQIRYSANFFRTFKFVAIALVIGSWSASAAYITVGAIQKEEFNVWSHYAAAPVAFITGFWFIVLSFDCRVYESLLT